MSKYLIPPHVFVSTSEAGAVFLDLRKDKYTAVDHHDTATLEKLVLGWPAKTIGSADSPALGPMEAGEIIAILLAEGLLTADTALGKDAAPICLEPANSTIDEFVPQLPAIRMSHRLRFTLAWIRVNFMRRFWSMERIVRYVRERKIESARRAIPFDPDRVRELVVIFFLLQPTFFSAHDACLRVSLTLIDFFAAYGVYPNWVFGVRTEPFAAHAWVQHESIALSDWAQHVRQYRPILVI